MELKSYRTELKERKVLAVSSDSKSSSSESTTSSEDGKIHPRNIPFVTSNWWRIGNNYDEVRKLINLSSSSTTASTKTTTSSCNGIDKKERSMTERLGLTTEVAARQAVHHQQQRVGDPSVLLQQQRQHSDNPPLAATNAGAFLGSANTASAFSLPVSSYQEKQRQLQQLRRLQQEKLRRLQELRHLRQQRRLQQQQLQQRRTNLPPDSHYYPQDQRQRAAVGTASLALPGDGGGCNTASSFSSSGVGTGGYGNNVDPRYDRHRSPYEEGLVVLRQQQQQQQMMMTQQQHQQQHQQQSSIHQAQEFLHRTTTDDNNNGDDYPSFLSSFSTTSSATAPSSRLVPAGRELLEDPLFLPQAAGSFLGDGAIIEHVRHSKNNNKMQREEHYNERNDADFVRIRNEFRHNDTNYVGSEEEEEEDNDDDGEGDEERDETISVDTAVVNDEDGLLLFDQVIPPGAAITAANAVDVASAAAFCGGSGERGGFRGIDDCRVTNLDNSNNHINNDDTMKKRGREMVMGDNNNNNNNNNNFVGGDDSVLYCEDENDEITRRMPPPLPGGGSGVPVTAICDNNHSPIKKRRRFSNATATTAATTSGDDGPFPLNNNEGNREKKKQKKLLPKSINANDNIRTAKSNSNKHSSYSDGDYDDVDDENALRSSNSNSNDRAVQFRAYQAENWTEKFEEFLEFRKEHGHCLVPNHHPSNPALAQWTKRQRYQYKLKLEGKRSTITDERIRVLEDAGFVWDSHSSVWSERFTQLRQFRDTHGHCNVPSRYKANAKLAIWVKRQRRQWKNKMDRKPNCMTDERERALDSIGFVWNMKPQQQQQQQQNHRQRRRQGKNKK